MRALTVPALNLPGKPRVSCIVTTALAERLASGALSAPAVTNQDADPDLLLVKRFCDGERRAFAELVRKYQRPLYYLALRYVRSPADADDLTQRAFVRMFKAMAKFRGAASFRSWAYRITINLCLNHLRDRRRETVTEVADDAITADAQAERIAITNQRSRRLQQAIETLPPKQRLVLELRVFDDLSFREVAELADCSENAAKVNFHHAVKRLRGLMQPSEQDPGGDQ